MQVLCGETIIEMSSDDPLAEEPEICTSIVKIQSVTCLTTAKEQSPVGFLSQDSQADRAAQTMSSKTHVTDIKERALTKVDCGLASGRRCLG